MGITLSRLSGCDLRTVPGNTVGAQPFGQRTDGRCGVMITVPRGIQADVQAALTVDDVQRVKAKTGVVREAGEDLAAGVAAA